MDRIRLLGITDPIFGLAWESSAVLRVGRHSSCDVEVDDPSISRIHAELRQTDGGWRLQDLGSIHGTFLNGVRLQAEGQPLEDRDSVRFGQVAAVIEFRRGGGPSASPAFATPELLVEAPASTCWEKTLQHISLDHKRGQRANERLLALLRAGYRTGYIDKEEELLRTVLDDAIEVLDAEHGAVALAQQGKEDLKLRVESSHPMNGNGNGQRVHYNRDLAQRTFSQGKSLLCCDHEMTWSMSVLLRTPRKRLGVMQFERNQRQAQFTLEDLHLADTLAANVSAGIENSQFTRKERELFLNTLTALAQTVEIRDPYTAGHVQRVTDYSLLLGEQLNLSEADLRIIRIGTPLHDIGKIGIEDSILRKDSSLTPEETRIMQSHPLKGVAILSSIPDLAPFLPIVRSHHERWDGKGYPDGLSGEHIPFLARIVAVADAFDAMTSNRPYRSAMSLTDALREVEKGTGAQFDPHCAQGFLQLRNRLGAGAGLTRETRELSFQTSPY